MSEKFPGGGGWWWYIPIIESALGPDLESREREEFEVNSWSSGVDMDKVWTRA